VTMNNDNLSQLRHRRARAHIRTLACWHRAYHHITRRSSRTPLLAPYLSRITTSRNARCALVIIKRWHIKHHQRRRQRKNKRRSINGSIVRRRRRIRVTSRARRISAASVNENNNGIINSSVNVIEMSRIRHERAHQNVAHISTSGERRSISDNINLYNQRAATGAK